jgi:tryptophan 2,3-dioxygenase
MPRKGRDFVYLCSLKRRLITSDTTNLIMTAPYEALYYGDYLHLPTILDAQKPRSSEVGTPAHDEMLFIITHQTYELWFKQILHELDAILAILGQNPVPEHDVATALHRLERIAAIGPILFQQIDVLETMTPMDFLDFRNVLYPASGFQSVQFRLVEIKLGLNRQQRVLAHLPLSDADKNRIGEAEKQPSLFSLVELWLERMPFIQKPSYSFWQEYQSAVSAMFERDRTMIRVNSAMSAQAVDDMLTQTDMNEQSFRAFFSEEAYTALRESGAKRLSFKASQAALFILLYREYPILHLPFRLLQTLIEIDENFSVWRYRHAQMAMRMIGTKVGTGGSSGFDYLMRATIQHRIFADFSALSAFLIPRGSLPQLPQEVASVLNFVYIDRQEQDKRTATRTAAADYVKTQVHAHFPQAYLIRESSENGTVVLDYTFPDDAAAAHALTFIAPLTDGMNAEYGVEVLVNAVPVHAA